MEKEITNNGRLIRPNQIPEVLELDVFIKALDEKYGVNSDDTKNSFGCLNMEEALVSHLYEANIYYFLYGYSSNIEHMPSYCVTIPKNTILKAGNSVWKKESLIIDEKDKKQLIQLRKKAYAAIKKVYPMCPVYEEGRSGRLEWDRQLKEQGFADSEMVFEANFKIGKDYEDWFKVSYELLSGNKAPYFSTCYRHFQNQEELPHESLAYQFYQKWNPFHLREMTLLEYHEMKNDVEELKKTYRHK